MEENNNNENKIKEIVKNETKKVGTSILKKIIPTILPAIGIFFLILLAIGVINLIPWLIQNMFASIVNIFNPAAPSTASNNQAQSIVYIDEDGKCNLKVEDFSEQILKELEEKEIDVEATGFVTENFEDMLDKYIKAEVQTTFPKTGISEFDGIITIKRASTETGQIQELKYVSYKKFCETNSNEVLEYFSVNPDTFELCIAKRGNITQYYDANGNLYKTEGGGIEKEEIDYQKYIQNYSAPLNFFIALHVLSQDEAFMNELLGMILGEGKVDPIVLTYVDSEQTQTIQYEYSGTQSTTTDIIDGNANNIINTVIHGNIDDIEEGTEIENINNHNVTDFIDDAIEYAKKEVTMYSGKLYITKADTWLKTSSKTITEMERKSIGENEQTNNKLDETKEPQYAKIIDTKTNESVIIEETIKTMITEKIISKVESKMYTVVDEESKIQVDKFVDLIRSYPKVENNMTTSPSNVFYLLQQTENTQKLEKIMRYVLYKLNDINYGISESDLELLLADTVIEAENVGNLRAYLYQFSHGHGGSPESEDGEYYKMYGDGVGWPTIGDADLQWKSNYASFNLPGKVMHNGEEKEVPNVAEYINSNVMSKGPDAKYTNAEVDAMDIYIEKTLVNNVGDAKQAAIYNSIVENDLFGLNLSRQQIYPLVAIHYNFGHLPVRNEKTFKQVYLAGMEQFEEKSWEHNKYVWDNWWCLLGGGAAGHIPSRDAAFETYVKGIFDFSLSDAGEVFGRNYYIYYTSSQLSVFDYAPNKAITRNSENEEEIFTMVEMSGEFTPANEKYIVGYYTSTMGRTFTILNQNVIRYENRDYWRLNDPPDGPGWAGRCNRAASAIIASGYSDQNPNELITTMNMMYDREIPTNKYWSLYGLEKTEEGGGASSADFTEIIRKQLAKGGYIAVWVNSHNSGYFGKSGMCWTKNIHWMAIIDYRVKDGKEQMVIADCRGADWYDIDEYKNGVARYALINEK